MPDSPAEEEGMIIAFCRADIFIPESGSLKSKRHILNSLTARIRNKFNVSVAEIDGNDLWQRSVLGLAVIANETRYANQVLSKIIQHIESDGRVQLLDYSFEMR